MKRVTIYTDGACSGNPGVGGWGAVLMYMGVSKEISGSCERTTNNRMELTAVIEALKCLKQPCEVDLFTDSSYVYNGFAQGWIWNWRRNGWKTATKKPVENQDLWQTLFELTGIHKVDWNKVKGHADNEFNNRCDKLATAAVAELKKTLGANEASRDDNANADGNADEGMVENSDESLTGSDETNDDSI
ncbi:MAG: ribonuclease HI [Clostridia bacterium]|nr:ribonuclease HI [Clostridia bacterium]